MTMLWWLLAAAVAAVTAWGLYGAVVDFSTTTLFEAIVRIVVEAVVGVIVVGYLIGRARAPRDGG